MFPRVYKHLRLSEKEESNKNLTTIFPFCISCESQNHKNEDLHESHGGCLDFQRKTESFTWFRYYIALSGNLSKQLNKQLSSANAS